MLWKMLRLRKIKFLLPMVMMTLGASSGSMQRATATIIPTPSACAQPHYDLN
jgi:hypothetical protein